MISVENFYHVVYDNLIKPVNLKMRYFWPFGTKERLIYHDAVYRDELHTYPLVLFHFDQEPIYQQDRSTIIDATWLWRPHHFPRILANSERSDLKKNLCRELGLIDWYFFYHGFAALDWYRAAKYFINEHPIKKAFISLNHLVRHRRAHRMALTARLIDRDLLSHGSISFHGTHQDCLDELVDPETLLSTHSLQLIERTLVKHPLPITLDTSEIDGQYSARFGHQDYDLRQQCLFHLVNESVFFDQKLHLTEKIFQPIVCGRPFVLAGAKGSLEYLKSYGFKTFGAFIDESYDQEPDPDRRMDMIVDQLFHICAKPLAELQTMCDHMRPILVYNKQHFFGEFRRIITEELVDNFDQCRRIWNNGLIKDDRLMPVLENLSLIKQRLLA